MTKRQFRMFLYNGYVEERKQENKTYDLREETVADACVNVRERAQRDFKRIGPNGIVISGISEERRDGKWVRLCSACGQLDDLYEGQQPEVN